MTHTPFDLNKTSLDTIALLLYGPYGGGKTHLQGDFLRWASTKGPVAFLNIHGEDGFASLGSMNLGAIGYTAHTTEEYEEILGQLKAQKCLALALDSLPAYYELLLIQKYGKIRYPDPKLDGEAAKNHWGQLNLATKNAVLLSRVAVPLVFWVAPWDSSDDVVTGGKGVTPNLPGKLAQECAGRFDFVGRLTAEALATGVQRTVSFAPTARYIGRQRIAHPVNQNIRIPETKGGWEAIYTALQAAITPPKKGT